MKKFFQREYWWVGTIFFGVTLLFLLSNVATSPTGLADSDELLTVSYLGGAAHPPGYSVLVSITHFAMRLFSFVDPAVIGNGLAAVFLAAGVAFFISALLRLVGKIEPVSTSVGILLGVVASLWTVASLNLFLLGTRMEVGAFAVFLMGLLFLAVVDWWQTMHRAKGVSSSFFVAFFIAGLGASHLQSFVLLFPGLLLLLIRGVWQSDQTDRYKKISVWMKAVGLFVFGIIISLVLLSWLNSRAQPVSWYFDPGLSGLWEHFSRQDYAGYFVDEGRSRQAYWAGLGSKMITSQPVYLRLFWENFSLLGIVLGILGLYYLFQKQRWWFYAGVLWYGLTGPLLAGYLGMPEYASQNLEYNLLLAVVQRQFVMSDLLWGGFIFLGIWYIYAHFSRLSRVFLGGFVVIVSVGLGALMHEHSQIVQTQNEPYIEEYAVSMLEGAADDSVIICSSDIACFSLLYAQYVKGVGEHTTVLTKNNVYRRYFISSQSEFFPFLYTQNPYYFSNLVAWNQHRTRVYLTNPDSFYIEYIGLDGEPFFLLPQDYLFEVVAAIPETTSSDSSIAIANRLISLPEHENDYWTQGFAEYIANVHQFAGVLQLFLGEERAAEKQLNTALTLKPNYERARTWRIQMNNPEAVAVFESGPLVSEKDLLTQAGEDIEAGEYEKAHALLLKTTFLNPESVIPRLQLAELYQTAGYGDLAAREWQHVLMFDPNNETAREALKNQAGLPVE